jgi:starvation-inducible outer membrane lipoprotein
MKKKWLSQKVVQIALPITILILILSGCTIIPQDVTSIKINKACNLTIHTQNEKTTYELNDLCEIELIKNGNNNNNS